MQQIPVQQFLDHTINTSKAVVHAISKSHNAELKLQIMALDVASHVMHNDIGLQFLDEPLLPEFIFLKPLVKNILVYPKRWYSML